MGLYCDSPIELHRKKPRRNSANPANMSTCHKAADMRVDIAQIGGV
jgi:hypothetical protein